MARFRRPDGRTGTYGQWAAEVSARWNALSTREQHASRDAAAERMAAQIRAQDTGPTLMHLYDEIGWFGVWPADVVDALSGIKGNIEVHLNSPGGNVFDGLSIYAALRQHPGTVSSVVDGLAASAASFVAAAAAPGQLAVTPNGTMMIHDAWTLASGNEDELRKMADVLGETSENVASIYAERSGRPAAEFRDLMRAETWAVGQKAIDLGLADTIRRPAAAGSDDGGATLTVAASLPWQVTIFNAAADMHGDHERYDPDGDGDCDACPEGDTDHDYWSADGQQLKPLPGKPMSADNMAAARILAADAAPHGPFTGTHAHPHPAMGAQGDDATHEHEHAHDGDADHDHAHAAAGPQDRAPEILNDDGESTWDASKAWHNGATAKDPAAFYEGICAGRKAGDPSKQSSWALPYRYHPGDAPNAAGVRNALARVDQTEGLTNKAAAKALLQKLMKQVNPDYEPSDQAPSGFLALNPEQIDAIREALAAMS